MRYLLDTNVLIDHARGRPAAVDLVTLLLSEPNDLLICDIVVTEALSGGTDEERSLIEGMLRTLEYVSTHPDAARWAAESRRQRRAGGPRSLADAIIAGVAWFNDATVVTRNPRDFGRQGVPVLAY